MKKQLKDNLKVYGLSALALGALVAGGNTSTVDAAEVNHTVQPGDTLFEIAAKYFGDGNRYHDIATVNNLSNPDLIIVGDTLTFDDEMEPVSTSTAETAKKEVVKEAPSKPVEAPKKQETPAPKQEAVAQTSSSSVSTQVPEYVLKVVQSEAGPSYQEKANVFSVIVNRVNSGRWGGTDYMSVVKAPGQFQVTWNGMADNATVDATTRQAVADVLANGVTTSAESFRASGDGVTNVFF